ncbi:hypothetical protein LXL04_033927 [Taraxacum kok-saghyz]
MAGGPNENTTPNNQKPFGITNIKALVPITLDLNQLNYDAWRELFTTHCRGFGVLGHLTGASKPKSDDDEDWHALDSVVKAWIYATLTPSLLNNILQTGSTSHMVWLKLENLFRDNKDTRAIELKDELRSITLGDQSIAHYCERITTLSNLLANIEHPVPEKTLVAYTLNGLSSKYEHIAMILRYKEPLSTFLQVRSKLVAEEQRLQRYHPQQPTHSDHASSPNALVTASSSSRGGRGGRGGRNNRGGGRNYDNRRNQRSGFSNTGAPTYPWQLAPWPAFPWMMPPNWFSGRPSMPQQQRHQQQPSGLLGPVPTQQPPARSSQPPDAAFHTATSLGLVPPQKWFPPMTQDQATDLSQVYNTMSQNDGSDASWYMDMGATNHLASDTGKLLSILNKQHANSVFVGNGQSIPVTHTGYSKIQTTHRPVHLHNVLVTPNIIKNLISVRRFTTDNRVSIG